MGGRALKDVKPIQEQNIWPTLDALASRLGDFGLDADYLQAHLLGSAGKQDMSGDLDVAVDSAVFADDILYEIEDVFAAANLPFKHHPLNNMLITGFPVVAEDGQPTGDLVQVDFILGQPEWLRFSHYSPGNRVSAFKGLYWTILLMVLAEQKKEFVLHDEAGNLLAEVCWSMHLKKGVCRRWKLKLRPDSEPSIVNPRVWETNVPASPPPRFSRHGYFSNPEDAIRILVGPQLKFSEIDTFEKLWAVVKRKSRKGKLPPLGTITDAYITEMMRTPVKHDHTPESLRAVLETL